MKWCFETSYINCNVEQKRIIYDSVEVLQEVEKAWASIEDRNWVSRSSFVIFGHGW